MILQFKEFALPVFWFLNLDEILWVVVGWGPQARVSALMLEPLFLVNQKVLFRVWC